MHPSSELEFSVDDLKFCRSSLAHVSRTFALNIKVLSGDLYLSVLLCYLLCRILDTIEDCPDKGMEWKVPLLDEFPRFLERYDEAGLEKWIKRAVTGKARPAEKELLAESARVLRGYFSLPMPLRKEVQVWVKEMSVGMAKYIKLFGSSSEIIIRDKGELENYCYYVAGTVGMFLTASFVHHYHLPATYSRELEKNAISFGLGLQLTNISKDLIEDRLRGWTYLPKSFLSKHGLSFNDFMELKECDHGRIESAYLDLLDLAMDHLKDAMRYTLALPPHCIRARIFCLWPLWMAVETLIVLKRRRKELFLGRQVKITRKDVKSIMASTTLMSPFNSLLEKDFEKRVLKFNSL